MLSFPIMAQQQVGGADVVPAVWMHDHRQPVIYQDVVQRKRRRSKKKSAAIIGGTAATGAAIGALAGGKKGAGIGAIAGGGAGVVYDQNTKKKYLDTTVELLGRG
jgi:hypothetical protein